MKSLFRPDEVPDRALFDDHRPLVRSLERRRLLRGGLSLGALVMLSGCDVDRPKSVENALLAMTRLTDKAQALLFDPNKLAQTYPASAILRPPKFNAYYDVTEVKPVDGAAWRLELAGLIEDKRSWTLAQFAGASAGVDGHQAYMHRGMELHRRLDGRAAADLSRARGRRPPGQLRRVQGPPTITRAASTWPRRFILRRSSRLRYGGDTLADPFGYPLRLRMATKLGYKNPKWVTAIEVTNSYPGGYWESRGYSWFRRPYESRGDGPLRRGIGDHRGDGRLGPTAEPDAGRHASAAGHEPGRLGGHALSPTGPRRPIWSAGMCSGRSRVRTCLGASGRSSVGLTARFSSWSIMAGTSVSEGD